MKTEKMLKEETDMFNKNLVKKSTALAITGALTIAMTATVMAAPGSFNGNRGPGGNGGFSGNAGFTGNGGPTGNAGLAGNAGSGEIMGQEMNSNFRNDSKNGFDGEIGQNAGQRPELTEEINITEDRPELPMGEEMTGERPELPEGEETTGERPELPGGADSETDFSGVAVRTDLTETSGNSIMKKGAKGQKPTGERPELPGGEEMTGERPELPEGEQAGRMGQRGERGRGMKGIDTTNIASVVSELEDGEVKTNLETLLEEYESAKTALETAVSDETEDIDTYRKAEMEAMKALREALDDAGIDTRPGLPQGERSGSDETGEEEGSVLPGGDRPEITGGEDGERPGSEEGDAGKSPESENAGNRPGMGQSMNGTGGQQAGQAPQEQGNIGQSADPGSVMGQNNDSADSIFERIGNWFKSLFTR